MPNKKLKKEVRETIDSQIDIEGFDYAMVEKIGPNYWDEGILPDEIKKDWNDYLSARKKLKATLREHGIDPQ